AGRPAGTAAADPRAGAAPAQCQAEHGGRVGDAGGEPGDGAEAAGGPGARRPGLDRDEVPGEGPEPPLPDGQRPGARRRALPARRAGAGGPPRGRLSGVGGGGAAPDAGGGEPRESPPWGARRCAPAPPAPAGAPGPGRRAGEAQERQRAEDNLELALQALAEVYFKTGSERVVVADDFQEVDREFLQTGLRFYEAFIRKNRGNPGARIETARAYFAIGKLR